MAFTPCSIFIMPYLNKALARIVAVVVPSPAISFVFLDTSFTNFAPISSTLSFSIIALATVTPSFVTFGLPNVWSRTTFLPFGPSVICTASASLLQPVRSYLRAFYPKCRDFFEKNITPDIYKTLGIKVKVCFFNYFILIF